MIEAGYTHEVKGMGAAAEATQKRRANVAEN